MIISKIFSSNISVYFIGNMLRRVVSFVMLPIYTRFLSPADYGTIELLSTILDFISIIVGMRIGQAIFRFYANYENKNDRDEIISTSLILVAVLNTFGVVIIAFFSEQISDLVLSDVSKSPLLVLFSYSMLGGALIEVPMVFLRASQRPWAFVGFSVLKLVTQLGLNIYFVVVEGMKVEGVIFSSVLSTLIVFIFLFIFIITKNSFIFSFEKLTKLTSFSWPLIFTSLIAFYINFGDRYFLKIYSGLADVGIYALAYKFGYLLNFLIVSPFFNHWDSERYNVAKHANATKIFETILIVYFFACACFVVFISLFINDILKLMSDELFWGASSLVPIILIAYLFNSLSDFTNFGIFYKYKTHLLIYCNLISGVVITVGYVFLIPVYGSFGAAFATVASFLARLFLITFFSQRLYPIIIPWKFIIFNFVFGCIVYGISLKLSQTLYISIFCNFILFLSYLLVVYLLFFKRKIYNMIEILKYN